MGNWRQADYKWGILCDWLGNHIWFSLIHTEFEVLWGKVSITIREPGSHWPSPNVLGWLLQRSWFGFLEWLLQGLWFGFLGWLLQSLWAKILLLYLVWPLYVVCLVSQLYYGYYAILCYRHIEFYMLVFLD